MSKSATKRTLKLITMDRMRPAAQALRISWPLKQKGMIKIEMEKSATYLANARDAEAGRAVYAQINQEFERGPEINRALLMQILQDNKDTEYGRKYGFAEIKTVEEYQKRVPVIVYDHIAEGIERMCRGEQNVLTAYPFRHMNETSGTIGIVKRIPMTQKQGEVFLKYNKLYMDGLKAELLDPSWMEGRAFCTSEGTHRTLPSGITVGCASSVMAEYVRGGKEALGQMMATLFTSPVEATIPQPGTDTRYIHARFALMDPDVTGIITGFYSLVVVLLKYIDTHYEMLIDDIEKGTISEKVSLSDEQRESLHKKLRPMPERAAQLREIFKNGPDLCWIPLVWPHMTYIYGAGGDGFSIYDQIIRTQYSGGVLKNLYAGVTASEGLWSVPGGIDTEDSVMAPGSAFFEFLPVECGSDFTKCVTMDQVEEGKIYELVVTNFCGFYRYRTSDAVQVTGLRGKTPTVRFMYRVNRTINMAAEKTTEKALQVAVENVMKELGLPLSDFSVFPNYEEMTYEFLIETDREDIPVSRKTLEECLLRHMREQNEVFAETIDEGSVKEPVGYWLQPQTGILYRDMMVFKGAPVNQIKPVRVIMNEIQRKFFYGLRMK